jgi:hypothetical protein
LLDKGLFRNPRSVESISLEAACSKQRSAALRLIALIEQAHVVERILRHLGLKTDRPEPRPGRAPPRDAFDADSQLNAAADATF